MNFEKFEILSNQIESESESYIKTHVAWGNGLINWYCLIRRSLNIALKIEKWNDGGVSLQILLVVAALWLPDSSV